MLKKPHYIALGLAALLSLVVLNLPANTTARLKLAIGSVFLPLFGLSRTSHQLAVKAEDAVTPRAELVRQNQQLRLANEQLQIRITQADAAMRENERLRQYFAWKPLTPWKDRLRLAKVIARDPANWWQTAWIDLGSKDGMRVDMPVLASGGATGYLIGRIDNVALTRSSVLLVSSPTCPVAAMIDKGREGRETGVLRGTADRPGNFNSMVKMGYLSGNRMKAGDMVITSDGGIFPAGILIGQVTEAPESIDFGLQYEVRVKLAVDLGAIQEVWVLQ